MNICEFFLIICYVKQYMQSILVKITLMFSSDNLSFFFSSGRHWTSVLLKGMLYYAKQLLKIKINYIKICTLQ